MAAQHFRHDDDWESAQLTCPKCGWTGTFHEGVVDVYAEVMDSKCPRCPWPDDPMLAIVSLVVSPPSSNPSDPPPPE